MRRVVSFIPFLLSAAAEQRSSTCTAETCPMKGSALLQEVNSRQRGHLALVDDGDAMTTASTTQEATRTPASTIVKASSCQCIYCGSDKPSQVFAKTCWPATARCSATKGGYHMGCYTDGSSECDCATKTLVQGTTMKTTATTTTTAQEAKREVVPNGGPCDYGLGRGETASCPICKKYKDGRTTGGFAEQPCVYVPDRENCFPMNHAQWQGWSLDVDCEPAPPTPKPVLTSCDAKDLLGCDKLGKLDDQGVYACLSDPSGYTYINEIGCRKIAIVSGKQFRKLRKKARSKWPSSCFVAPNGRIFWHPGTNGVRNPRAKIVYVCKEKAD